ncbi:MAG: response regulator [Holophagae bacterium]|jgi:CheY-like chemotaxis protein
MNRPEDKTILIVDDEPDIVAYFSGILERAGFNVVTAHNGNQALEEVHKHPPDFISLDLVMPGKSGIRFLYELRKNREWARIPIMIVTAHARDDLGKGDFDEIFSDRTMVGPLTYLEKPVNPERFLHSVMKVLGMTTRDEEAPQDTKDHLRNRIASHLEEADLQTLEKLVRALDNKMS